LHYGTIDRNHYLSIVDKLPLNIACKYLWFWIGHINIEGIALFYNTFLEAFSKQR